MISLRSKLVKFDQQFSKCSLRFVGCCSCLSVLGRFVEECTEEVSQGTNLGSSKRALRLGKGIPAIATVEQRLLNLGIVQDVAIGA